MRSVVLSSLLLSHTLAPSAQAHVQLVDVTYQPGAASKPHSHDCPAVVYVVSGIVKSRVRGGALHVYGPGSSFYEAAHNTHQVSANASTTKPAHFIAFFICEDHP